MGALLQDLRCALRVLARWRIQAASWQVCDSLDRAGQTEVVCSALPYQGRSGVHYMETGHEDGNAAWRCYVICDSYARLCRHSAGGSHYRQGDFHRNRAS
jgi:hypothetical protein